LYGIVRTETRDEHLAGYATLLFLLLPSTQIYYCASLEAIIATLLLGVLYFFIHPKPPVSFLGSLVCLLLSSFLTFGFLFIIPVIVGFEILQRKGIFKSAVLLCAVGLVYLLIDTMFGYNYFHSFAIASAIENPHGFSLLAEPANYVLTRLEGIAELIVFFGPVMCVFLVRGIKSLKPDQRGLLVMTTVGVFTVLAMLASGAYRTGETARVLTHLYPLLAIPVAVYTRNMEASAREETTLLAVVFSQTVLMQAFGTYVF
jgi:hypothetical protein